MLNLNINTINTKKTKLNIFSSADVLIEIGNIKISRKNFFIIAGPCSVESKEQIYNIASRVKKAGADILRGGAFKPRTSPYSFQGIGEDGLKMLLEAKKETGMPVVSEIVNIEHLPLYQDIDILQVGARNMQNFELLKALGSINKPILLKRGFANTVEELLMSAEYIISHGNKNVILCERGIRTFETATRNTLDISAVPILKKLTNLPIVVDPSHACGIAELIHPLCLASVAAGADGIMVEVHDSPENALSDKEQSITTEQFKKICDDINILLHAMNRKA